MEYAQRQKERQDREPEAPPQDTPETREKDQKLSDDVDAILDEIDGVLEVNAEEFVANYQQKGGQLCYCS